MAGLNSAKFLSDKFLPANNNLFPANNNLRPLNIPWQTKLVAKMPKRE